MNLNKKYNPICLSELEIEYPKIIEYLETNKTFIINGPKYSGKSTIIKLYLNYLNYDYLLLDDTNTSKEYIIDKLKYASNSVFSYFFSKKYVVIIDNFDCFEKSEQELLLKYSLNSQFIIITNKYLNTKINYVRINNYSQDYLINLYIIIYFLEIGSNCETIPEFYNIYQMYSILEFNLNTHKSTNNGNNNSNNNYKLIYDKFNYEYRELVLEKNFEKKLYILDKFKTYSIFQHNLIYNYSDIDNLADSYDYLSNSLYFLESNIKNVIFISKVEYYPILTAIGTSYKLDDFKIYKENFHNRKNKNFKNNYY